MLIYALLAAVVCLAVIMYAAYGRDIVAPAVVVPAAFAFCIGLAAAYTLPWGLPMHLDTCAVILAMVLFFELGAGVAGLPFPGAPAGEGQARAFLLPLWLVGALTLLILAFAYLNYQELLQISRQFTSSHALSDIIGETIHQMQLGNADRFSRWYSYRMFMAQSAAYACLMAFLYNLVYGCRSWLYNLRFLLPVAAYLLMILFTGSRQPTVYVAIFLLVAGSLLYRRRENFTAASELRVLLLLLLVAVGFVAAFYGLGTLSGKIDETKTVTSVLAHYAGTNISAFDYFLHHLPVPETEYIGTMTLIDVYAKLGLFVPDLPAVSGYIREFVDFGLINTNVYTALRRYIQDYGFVGCALIMFLLGLVYQYAYNFLKYRGGHLYGLLLYSSFCFPVFLLCREERFLMDLMNTSTIYVALLLFVFYRLLLLFREGEAR